MHLFLLGVSHRTAPVDVRERLDFSSRDVGAAVEAQWATVPDALGQDPNAVSQAFDETNLGGVTYRVKLVIGR